MRWMTWQEEYKSKAVTAGEAAKLVKSGDVVGFGLAFGGPSAHLVDALLDRAGELEDVRVLDPMSPRALKLHDPEVMEAVKGHITYSAMVVFPPNRKIFKTNHADYQTLQSSDCGSRMGEICNVAMVMACPPEAGMINLGLSNFLTPELIAGANIVIAEINDQMPKVYGDNWMPVSAFDYFVEHSSPIPEFKRKGEPSELEMAIAENVASLIKSGDCIQMGLGTLPEAIIRLLRDKGKKDLGCHTEMFPMGLPDLVREGIVTNKLKKLHPGKTVASFCMGDRDMYDYVTENPDCIFFPTSYTNAPHVLRQVDNLIAINMDLEVDFMGQLTSETVNGNRLVGTTGGQLDFVIGSAWSKGGRAINVLPSTRTLSSGEKVSTIVPGLAPGTHVTIPHMYTQFVVTEYGIADLWLKTRRERAEALVSIAHPDFRAELRKEAMKRLY